MYKLEQHCEITGDFSPFGNKMTYEKYLAPTVRGLARLLSRAVPPSSFKKTGGKAWAQIGNCITIINSYATK